MLEIRVELAEGATEEGRPVEVLRPGTFVDRFGREVEITEEDLQAYVATFEQGQAEQDVPIDVDHERGQAAGWLRGLWVEAGKLLARVDWTSLGRQLVGERLYRYVSASIDTGGKVIKSVSLVNFPAVKGLAPVELEEGTRPSEWGRAPVQRREAQMSEQEVAELRERIRREEREAVEAELAAQEAELAAQREREAELRREVRAEVEADLRERMARHDELVAFAESVCGGEVGLAADPGEVVAFLSELQGEMQAQARHILEAGVVEFRERGSSRGGKAGRAALPEEYRASLRMWVDDGHPIEAFFAEVAPELQGAEAYDLSEYEGE